MIASIIDRRPGRWLRRAITVSVTPLLMSPALIVTVLAVSGPAMPALAQTVSTIETRSSPSEVVATPLSASELARSNAWGLSDTEWRRYQNLKLGIRGSVSTTRLSPLEVLGIHARDAAERRGYAERWARAMREDAERILAFQHAYDVAAKRLFAGQPLIDVGKLQQLPQKTSELQRDDRVLFFTDVMCPPCDAVLVKLLSRLDTVAGIDIFLMEVPENDDSAIRAWAEKHRINADWVRKGQVTLNHDNGTLQNISDGPLETPALFVRRNDQLSKLSYAEL